MANINSLKLKKKKCWNVAQKLADMVIGRVNLDKYWLDH